MEINDMNDKFFQDLFGEQMNKIKDQKIEEYYLDMLQKKKLKIHKPLML